MPNDLGLLTLFFCPIVKYLTRNFAKYYVTTSLVEVCDDGPSLLGM